MVITLYTFPYPPHTVGPFNGQGLPQDYASVGTIRDHSGAEVSQFYTNGAGLVGEEGLDPRLRNILMRCLALIPAHRPGLVELQAWASDAETNPGFFGDIGGVTTSTELADKFICRPRSVSISSTRPDIPNAVLTMRHDSLRPPLFRCPTKKCDAKPCALHREQAHRYSILKVRVMCRKNDGT